ncbi:hypothetical protein D3C74_152340 [compost metagenome]
MKQRITVEQLKELTGLQQEHLRELYSPEEGDWFYRSTGEDTEFYGSVMYHDDSGVELFEPEKIDLPLLSIGQMIQLLNPESSTIFTFNSWPNTNPPICEISVNGKTFYEKNICDALWESVKKIL